MQRQRGLIEKLERSLFGVKTSFDQKTGRLYDKARRAYDAGKYDEVRGAIDDLKVKVWCGPREHLAPREKALFCCWEGLMHYKESITYGKEGKSGEEYWAVKSAARELRLVPDIEKKYRGRVPGALEKIARTLEPIVAKAMEGTTAPEIISEDDEELEALDRRENDLMIDDWDDDWGNRFYGRTVGSSWTGNDLQF